MSYTMDNLLDGKKDFSGDFKTLAAEITDVADTKGIDEAVNQLLALEKKCRQFSDFSTLKDTCVRMVRLCKERGDWTKLNAVLLLINKRNAQVKLTITTVVEESMTYIEATPATEVKIELIKTLKDICDGKIYVEGESARLHLMLSKIYESKGDTDAACDIIQDVHVETYGSLSKKEKAEYILEQMRLNLLKKDYIRTMIHSRKMNTKTIEEEGFEEVKRKFYTMMIEYHSAEKNTWEIAQAYYKIWDTSSEASADTSSQIINLESCILFLLCSKFDNHQSDMMHRVKLQLSTDKRAESICSAFKTALTVFTTDEIIPTPFSEQREVLETHSSLSNPAAVAINPDFAAQLVSIFHDRVVQHNIRVVAKYYKRIRSVRLCQILQLSQEKLEEYLTEMTTDGDVATTTGVATAGAASAGAGAKAGGRPASLALKIDRPAGIITFKMRLKPEEVLTDWSFDVAKLLQLTESTCHMINRENMVYKV